VYDVPETRINKGRNGGHQVTSSRTDQWVSLHNERNSILENDNQSKLNKTCTKCKATKPLAAFRYRLTRAQAKQQGYAGNVLVTAEGKVCVECRPKRKPLSKLTNKELEAKAATGDIPLAIAKARIAQHKKDANLLRKRARVERWHEVWADAWAPLWEDMQADIEAANGKASYYRKRKIPEKVKFYEAYVATLRKEMTRIKYEFRQKPCRPKYTRWEECVPEQIQYDLKQLWEAMPLAERMGGNGTAKMPRMVGYRYDPEANLYVHSKPNDELNERIKWLAKNNHALPTSPTFIDTPPTPHLTNVPPPMVLTIRNSTKHEPSVRETPAERLAKYGKPIDPPKLPPSGIDWDNLLDE
jgi:hypothetical protein